MVIIVSALRTRAFPLAVQQMALWFAVLAGLLGGLIGQPWLGEPLVAGILAGIAGLVVIMVLARPRRISAPSCGGSAMSSRR